MPSHIEQTCWFALLERLGLSDLNATTYGKLTTAYSKPELYYHTLAHIDDCLVQLATCDMSQERSDTIAVALWFHDAVYNWRSKTNEADSAAWADKFLKGCDAPEELATEVHGLIMATQHFVPEPLVGDQQLMVDIDLSILGRETEVYDRYETAIRKEYKWVPNITYRRERRKALRSFLDRDRIFLTDRFYNLYEEAARQNLANAIQAL